MSEVQNGLNLTGDIIKDWWAKLLVGIFLIGFGILCFIFPGMVLLTAIVILGGLCLFLGIIMMLSAFSGQLADNFKLLALFEGILLIIIGLMTFFWPDVTTLTLVYLFGFLAVVLGLFRMIDGFMMPKQIKAEVGSVSPTLLIIGGLFSFILGIIVLIFPGESLLAILWLVGAYAIVFGIFMIAASIAGEKK